MAHPITRQEQDAILAACFAELGIDAHPNTVSASMLEVPGGRGHVVTVTNVRRGPLRVHLLLVAQDGEITRPRHWQQA